MLEVMQSFQADIKAGPAWIDIWLNFLSFVLILSIPFSFVRKEARWVLLSLVLVFPSMMFLYTQIGFVRLLGIVHIIFWTPLLVYLWRRRSEWRVAETWAGKWIVLAFAVITISLAFDYTDVIRWLLGERGQA